MMVRAGRPVKSALCPSSGEVGIPPPSAYNAGARAIASGDYVAGIRRGGTTMPVTVGSGEFTYEALESWQKLPDGVTLTETPGVAVNSQDRVYALTRNTSHPVMVFEADGTFVFSFGEGVFSQRTHGILIGPDDAVYCADDGTHTITKFSTDGKLLMTIGERNHPAPAWSGQPFNRPTHAAVSPVTGNLYISDGYGNSRV